MGGAERLLVSLLPHIAKGNVHVDVVSLFTDTSLSQELEEYSAPTNQDNNLKFLISNELNLTKQFGVKNYE